MLTYSYVWRIKNNDHPWLCFLLKAFKQDFCILQFDLSFLPKIDNDSALYKDWLMRFWCNVQFLHFQILSTNRKPLVLQKAGTSLILI